MSPFEPVAGQPPATRARRRRRAARLACGGFAVLAASPTLLAVRGAEALPAPAADGGTVDIYSSLPLQGASRAQTEPLVNGIRLALSAAGGAAGNSTVHYVSLDDSTAQAGGWDPSRTVANATRVAGDANAVYYIGEFNSGASQLAIPILNEAGIAEVSPSNTYVGLTRSGPGAAPGEPQKFYPTGRRTYLRIVPNDRAQASALLNTLRLDHCARVAMANDGPTYGAGIAGLIEAQKRSHGVDIVSNTRIDPRARDYRAYAARLKARHADCFVFAGIVADGGVQIAEDVGRALPKARIYGPDGMCTPTWTNPAAGGVPLRISHRIQCTQATLDLRAYPGGPAFLAAYRAAYGGGTPDAYAIYGYEAMKLALDTIAALGPSGNDRAALLSALFATRARASVLGTYGFDANGDTTLNAYGLYKTTKLGHLVFERVVAPSE